MDVKRLDGQLLNFWVAKSAGLKLCEEDPQLGRHHDPDGPFWNPQSYNPAIDWSHAGNIISQEWYVIEDTLIEWFGSQWSFIPAVARYPLVWFLRAYVASQFGNEVEDIQEVPMQQPSFTDTKA